jgi:hypothetical protein
VPPPVRRPCCGPPCCVCTTAALTPVAPSHPPPRTRRLAHTIKRARWLNLLTPHAKPHPKLRFTSLTPTPLTAGAAGGPADAAGSAATGAVKVASPL